MTDEDYWKRQYQPLRPKAGEREKAVSQIIENLTGRKLKAVGLGAESEEFLPGSAASQGHERGGADYAVIGTNIYLEVTGPNVTVRLSDPLWLRPDKIANARSHFPERDTWVVHCVQRVTIRVIQLDQKFFSAHEHGKYVTVHPIIRGATETYVAIPADDESVQDFAALINHIKNWKARGHK